MAVNPLLTVPTHQQARLLDVIWSDYARRGSWPNYHYVATLLYRDPATLDAAEVLRSCPSLRYYAGFGGYGWIWLTSGDPRFPKDDDQVGLTVVGMSRLPQAQDEVTLFLCGLNALVEIERSVTPDPTAVQPVDVTSDAVSPYLPAPRLGYVPLLSPVTRLGEILHREPSTRPFIHEPPVAGHWVARLDSSVRSYYGVRDVDDYAQRVAALVSPPKPEPPPVLVSSLALPEAIDYLNTVWRGWAKGPLFLIRRAEAAAKLAHDCRTEDEFESRLTALYGIFCATRVPGRTKDGKPGDLKPYLTKHVPPGGRERALAAVQDLQDFLSLRAWRQHPDAEDRGVAAMRSLGVQLPTDDWGEAWRTLQARMVMALNALREQIEILDAPS